jgi:CelD/BcsL family acetyltransferase involved in cellulose biosynthesis
MPAVVPASELIIALDDLDAVYDGWDELACSAGLPQMSPAWILAWWRHLAPVGAAPRVVVVRDRGEIIGLAPFYIEDGRRARVDYRLPGIDLAARLAPLAMPGREWEVGEAIAGHLTEATPQPDLIALEGAPLASPWAMALREGWPGPVSPILRQYSIYGCPTVALREESFDAWFADKSSNFRSQMRRLRRQFDTAGGTVRSSTEETLEADIDTFLRMHASRWEHKGESNLVAFGDRLAPMLKEVGSRLLDEQRFHLRLLEIDSEPISAQLFLSAGANVLYLNSGWYEQFAQFKPSMLGILGVIEDAFARGYRLLDLGLGEQAYKLRFADGNDPVAWNVLIVPSRRLPLTYARILPTLAGSYLREAARRALPTGRADQLRALRSRLRP